MQRKGFCHFIVYLTTKGTQHNTLIDIVGTISLLWMLKASLHIFQVNYCRMKCEESIYCYALPDEVQSQSTEPKIDLKSAKEKALII